MWLTEFGSVDSTVYLVMAILSFINLVFGLAVLILVFKFRNGVAGTSMDFYICCGCILFVFSVLLRGISTDFINFYDFNILCQVFPSVLTVSLLWVCGGLLIKTSAVLNFYKNHYGDEALRHEWKPNVWMIPLIIVDATTILVWIIGFPPVASRVSETIDVYQCGKGLSSEFQLGVSAYHAVLLLLTAILVWPARYYARSTDCSDEMTSIILVVYNLVVVAIVGTLVYAFFDMTVSTLYAGIGGLIQYAAFSTFIGLLVGKILTARKYHGNKTVRGAKRGWMDLDEVSGDPYAHSVSDKASSSARDSSASDRGSGSDSENYYLDTAVPKPDAFENEDNYISPTEVNEDNYIRPIG